MIRFLLSRHVDAGEAATGAPRIEPLAPQTGLPEALRIRSWYTLDIRGIHPVTDASLLTTREGHVVLAAGSFGYRGQSGREALAAFEHDFEPPDTALGDGRVAALAETVGQFVVVIARRDRAWVVSDRGGMAPIYHHPGSGAISNSWLMICEAPRSLTVDRSSLLERVYLGGASGRWTEFAEIERVVTPGLAVLDPGATTLVVAPEQRADHQPRDFAAAVSDTSSRLNRLFATYRAMHAGPFITPLTGGFDSRLTVAALRAVGVTPRLLVYGSPQDADVRIAGEIARAEGLELDHLDKSLHPQPTPDEFPDVMRESFRIHDGRGIDGVFGNGADVQSRFRRARDGAMYLNGGGGEIYRNFWRVLHAGMTIDAFLQHRYERLDRSSLRDPSDWQRMLARLAATYAQLVDSRDGRLSRQQVDALYIRQRMRYWMAPDNQVNNLFGLSMLPYSEADLTAASLELPVAWRENGRFQAALITALDPALAHYRSAYGWPFDGAAPLKTRLRTWLKLRTPGALRQRYQRKIVAQRHGMANPPFWAQEPWRAAVFGGSEMLISEYIDLDAIGNVEQLNRALTLELVLRRSG